jgi:hypothetical protein
VCFEEIRYFYSIIVHLHVLSMDSALFVD